MFFSDKFITRTLEYNTMSAPVNAPYLRREFETGEFEKVEITICSLGLYELYVNGKNITKGLLSPYIHNPTDFSYYDNYDITSFVKKGKNAIGVVLGNGLNDSVVKTWDFDKFSWRSSPKLALAVETDGKVILEADKSFKAAPSPVTFDDVRSGCHYDARLEQKGWNEVGFDDGGWTAALEVKGYGGEKRIVTAPPITIEREVKPLSVTKQKKGYLYDFGINSAGLPKMILKKPKSGQVVTLLHGEWLQRGKLTTDNILCNAMGKPYLQQTDVYTARGDDEEIFIPSFTYHGFQYIFVTGITEEQATEGLLTFLIAHSDMEEKGSFSCSDDVANRLQKIARNSDLSNFYYFPTDCPQREKNGWTGDAAVSAEHMLLNFDCTSSYVEWLRGIRKAQNEKGALPGIVPTGGWGFKWGNGPCWDAVLTYLPYYVYRYTGDKEIIRENASAIDKYLHYLDEVADKHPLGLIDIGLGDWLQPMRAAGGPDAPIIVTNSIMSHNIAKKAEVIFDAVGEKEYSAFARKFSEKLRERIRKNLVDLSSCTVKGDCQTSQLCGLFYGMFDKEEEPKAVEKLIELIKKEDDHFATGMVGSRIIFHTLTKYGYSDLAYKMITQDTFPAFGYWLKYGATSLWESFNLLDDDTSIIKRKPLDSEFVFVRRGPFAKLFKGLGKVIRKLVDATQVRWAGVASLNHHFFGDISGWFIKAVAGINVNPNDKDVKNVEICPHFIEKLNYAEAYHNPPYGKIYSKWERKGDGIDLTVEVPEEAYGSVVAPEGWLFEDKENAKPLKSGKYRLIKG